VDIRIYIVIIIIIIIIVVIVDGTTLRNEYVCPVIVTGCVGLQNLHGVRHLRCCNNFLSKNIPHIINQSFSQQQL